MYFIIAVIVFLSAFVEFFRTKRNSRIPFLVWMTLTALLCLRYGQGTDFFSYELQFELIDVSSSFLKNSLYHGELGWYMMLLGAKKIGISFSLFVGLISLLEMFLIKRAIDEMSPYKNFSYLLLLPTFFMTYFFSALRQGIVLSFFLGIGLKLLMQKRDKVYLFMIFLLSFIHTAAIILIIAPYLDFFKRKPFFLIYMCALIFLSFIILRPYLSLLGSTRYFEEGASIGGILIRILMTGIIVYLHRNCKRQTELSEQLYTYYLVGFSIFMALSFTSVFSQRLTMPFKAIEILLIPILFYQCNISKSRINTAVTMCFTLLILIMGVEYAKNIDSYLKQGNYSKEFTMITYPYVSVFDKSEIYRYRSISYENI